MLATLYEGIPCNVHPERRLTDPSHGGKGIFPV